MSNYIRSVSQSFTDFNDQDSRDKARLRRGLRNRSNSTHVEPNELPEHMNSEHRLVMRQVISALDKTIKKRNRLSQMSLDAYIRRTHLAACLWERLVDKLTSAPKSFTDADKKSLYRSWNAKVHPYAEKEVNHTYPENDENAVIIERLIKQGKINAETLSAGNFHGRWHDVFFPPSGSLHDYTDAADAIFAHLFEREKTIVGQERSQNTSRAKRRQTGLVQKRGDAISRSAHNPNTADEKKAETYSHSTIEFYFKEGDIAAEIYNHLSDCDLSKEEVFPSWFGDRLYQHFGRFKDKLDANDDLKDEIWRLHNAVRKFYAKLAKTKRFQIALRAEEIADGGARKLSVLLPKDSDDLLAQLTGIKKNADMSHAIRMGKLLVHASDVLLESEDVSQEELDRRIRYLTTSDGQSEIKQSEVFARVWRRAVHSANRTIKGLADPKSVIHDRNNRDILASANSQRAVQRNFDSAHFRSQIPVLFGDDKHVIEGETVSRSEGFLSADERLNQQTLWGLLALARRYRNAVFHHNVRHSLINIHHGGEVLNVCGEKQANNFANIGNIAVSSHAMSSFRRLLNFDLRLQIQALKKRLAQTKAVDFLRQDQLVQLIKEFSAADDQTIHGIPRFINVISFVHRLNKSNSENMNPDLLMLLRFHSEAKAKEKDADLRCRIDLAQLLYETGFRRWLVAELSDPNVLRKYLAKFSNAKSKRQANYDKASKRQYSDPTTIVGELGLEQCASFDELLSELQSEAAREQDLDLSYNPNRKAQQKVSSRVQQFKLEFFAHLFSKFLVRSSQDGSSSFRWLADISEPLENNTADLNAALEKYHAAGHNEIGADLTWQPQFYTWLYLVPPSEASQLRQQIQKSLALDAKLQRDSDDASKVSAEETKLLREMEQLIALYTRVESEGFSGHEIKSGVEKLFEDPNLSDNLYSEQFEDHTLSHPGTRRGLRQLARFSHNTAFSGFFSKHKISNEEVRHFANSDDLLKTTELFETRNKSRSELLKLIDERPQKERDKDENRRQIQREVQVYKTAAIEASLHNFRVETIRLTDHIRLHQIVTRILARLTDYTLIWERDSLYSLLGMLYQKSDGKGFHLARNKDGELGIQPTDMMISWLGNARSDQEMSEVSRFVPFYSKQEVFGPKPLQNLAFDLAAGATPAKSALIQYRHAFIEETRQNQKDIDYRNWLRSEKNITLKDRKPFRMKRAQIRNDLAHHNVLDLSNPNKGVNLTYVMNSVRSLMAYDRKLKNAVPKSVKKILADYGLAVEWRMRNDRLSQPVIYPDVERHLEFIPRHLLDKPVELTLPKASARLVSMVQATFDFGGSGHGETTFAHGKKTVEVAYPSKFRTEFPATPKEVREGVSFNFASEKR